MDHMGIVLSSDRCALSGLTGFRFHDLIQCAGPLGLDFDQLRNDVKPVQELTVGDFLEAVEKDVKLTATLKNGIDSIVNP